MPLTYSDFLVRGLSTDTKPTLHPNTGAALPEGWRFCETDTNAWFYYDGAVWVSMFGTAMPTTSHSMGAQFMDASQIAVPANPGTGVRRIFVDSADGKLKVRTSGGSSVSLEEQGGAPTFGVPTGNIDIGDAAAEGASANATRADHQHAFTAPAIGYPVDVGVTEADGTLTTPARADHQHAHGALLGPASAHRHSDLATVGANDHHTQSHDHSAAGDGQTVNPSTLQVPRKADPVSPVVGELWLNTGATQIEYRDNQATPANQVLMRDGQTAAGELAGTYPNPTVAATHSGSAHHTQSHGNADHTAAPIPSAIDIGDGAVTGTDVGPARGDHQHAFTAPATGYPVDADLTAEADGTATTPARSDHRHAVTAPAAGYPVDVAATEADGTGTTLARSDHRHAHGSGYLADAHHAQAHTLSGADHTGALIEAQTPLTTKGDLLVTDGTTLQRVPIGTNDQVLTADSVQASGVKWATPAGGGGAWTTAVKTADQTNNTTTLADVTEMQLTTVANTQYTVRFCAFLLTNATADSKYRLVHTGTTTRVRRRVQRTATTDIAQTIELKTAFDSADVVLSTTGLNPWVEENIILQVGATGGVLKMQFAQVTANAGPTQVLEGSHLESAVA